MLTQHQDSRVLSLCYNEIAHIEQQQKIVSSTTLQSLAELFVRHGVHNDFGVFLLHRHRELAHNTAMVHRRADADTDICMMEELGRHMVSPCMFLSHAPDEFLPFEYETPPRGGDNLPSQSFLLELGSYLWDHQLQEIIGLCRVSPVDDPWIESLLSDDGDTIATRIGRSISPLDGTITQWGFLREGEQQGQIRIKLLRACKESESGGHFRT